MKTKGLVLLFVTAYNLRDFRPSCRKPIAFRKKERAKERWRENERKCKDEICDQYVYIEDVPKE